MEMASFVVKSQQEEAAAALLQLCGSPTEASEVLVKSAPLSMQAQGTSNEANKVSMGRTPLSSKAQPFAPSQEGQSDWANTCTTTYLVEQSPPLGGISAIPIAQGDWNKHYQKTPSEGKWSFRQEEVDRGPQEASVRCSRCGTRISAHSQFCNSCGAPITGGMHCNVHKHATMGIAIVSLRDMRVREAILRAGRMETIAGVKVELRPHKDRVTKEEVMNDIFVAWGHKVEKATPLWEHDIAKFFDQKHIEFVDAEEQESEPSIRGENIKRAGDFMACNSTTCGASSSSDDRDFDSLSDFTTASRGRQKEEAYNSGERWPSRTPSPPRVGLHPSMAAWDFPAAAWDANGPKATPESSAIFAACVPLEVASPPQAQAPAQVNVETAVMALAQVNMETAAMAPAQINVEAAAIFTVCEPLEADAEEGHQNPLFGFFRSAPPPEQESGPCNAKVLPVKNTFIHYSEGPPPEEADISLPDGDEAPRLKSLSRSASAPGLMMENPVFTLMSNDPEEPEEAEEAGDPEEPEGPEEPETLQWPSTSMWEVHSQRSCNPCAYFHAKEDSCRQGAQCKFCHMCPPGAIKKMKKYKKQKMKMRLHSFDSRTQGRWVFIRD